MKKKKKEKRKKDSRSQLYPEGPADPEVSMAVQVLAETMHPVPPPINALTAQSCIARKQLDETGP